MSINELEMPMVSISNSHDQEAIMGEAAWYRLAALSLNSVLDMGGRVWLCISLSGHTLTRAMRFNQCVLSQKLILNNDL